MAVAVALACALPAVAGAQVVVTTPVDGDDGACTLADCTLREAIMHDTATEIELPHDAYPLVSELFIDRQLTIRGTQSSELATLMPAPAVAPMRIVLIDNGIAAQMSKVRIVGGETNAFGGGVLVSPAASLVLTDSEVTGNEASSGGGIWANGTLTLVRTTVAGNAARGDPETPGGRGGGVGLASDGPSATMVNSTLSGNMTTGQGGGLYTARSSVLRGVSIVDNVAPPRVAGIGQGGGLFQDFTGGEETNTRNVLVARNVNGGCGGTQDFPIDADNGLIDEPLPNTTCNAQGVGNRIEPNAFVGPLADNGGLTRTHMLLGNSPAIDRGASCEDEDQRGIARPFGQQCDIGAVERDALPDVNVLTDETPDGCTIDHCTLRERVEDAPANDLIILGSGTYVLSTGEPLLLDDNVTIVGAGARATTIDANRTSRIGSVVDGAIVEVDAVTATRGNAPADAVDGPGLGGAFYVDPDSQLAIFQSALIDNAAYGAGGAISNAGGLQIVESLLSRNRVVGNNPANGGAIHSVNSVELVNSTLSGNQAVPDGGGAARGGGLYVAGVADIESVTIAENSATEGAGFYDATGVSTIFGALIVRNAGPECGFVSLPADTSDRSSLADDATCDFDGPGSMQGVDPRLAPLANNGGPTDTHALYTGSPALDGADLEFCPVADQRLVARPDGDCDIGAFEGSIAPPQDPPPPPPPPGDDPPQPSQELPPPVAGRNVNAEPAGGTVMVKVKGSRRFVELEEGQQIPVGSEIDTRKGRVTIEAAGGSVATFYDGLFRFDQGRGARPLTTLTLIERLACPKRGGKASAAAKRKKKRRLWGDGSGKFRTSGEYSSATVRGTRWLVEDRCDSTLTRVRQGSVSVRDKVKRKTVIVRAGKQYVAKRRR